MNINFVRTMRVSYDNAALLIFGLFFIILFSVFIPNMGGAGTSLPRNLVAWMLPPTVLAALMLRKTAERKFNVCYTIALGLFIAGVLILCIPFIYSPNIYASNAILRILALSGGIIFYFTMLNIYSLRPFTGVRDKLLLCIFFSCVIQMIFSLSQYLGIPAFVLKYSAYSYGGRPYALFQQINIHASYLAVGVALSLYFIEVKVENQRWVSSFLIAILFFCLNLGVAQSQVGYLGFIVIYASYVLIIRKRSLNRIYLIGLVSSAGFFLSFILNKIMNHSPVDHSTSTGIRWWLIKNSLKMFSERPFSGWGYGSFEHYYNLLFKSSSNFTHPHNEFLLWLTEGGCIALAGMCVIAYAYIILLYNAEDTRMKLIWVATLPITLHMMTEFPLYISAQHWLVLIMLLSAVDGKIKNSQLKLNNKCSVFVSIILIATSIFSILLLTESVVQSVFLTSIERAGRQDKLIDEPYPVNFLNQERYQYDYHTGLLLTYNANHERYALSEYSVWADKYLMKHNDKNVKKNKLTVDMLLNRKLKK